jgi:hypothetical protein
MGPRSKEAVCAALGFLIDESQQQRATLIEIKRLLEQRRENDNEDLEQVHKRLTALERRLGGGGHGAPTPAE